jgi:hypothetical protein
MDLPVESSLDQILLQLIPAVPSQKVLFWGEGAGGISSYVAGWMAGEGADVIVLDGANRFDPYMVSSFAKKTSVSPETLLKRIRIARAFTCYQMTALVEEKLASLRSHPPWVILLGPVSTFLDEDVPEWEVRPLFERLLRKVEEMAKGGVSFFFFQPHHSFPPFLPVGRQVLKGVGGLGGLADSKRAFLARRLFYISDLVWKISLEDEGPKLILKKGAQLNIIENCKLQNKKCKFGESLKCLSIGR